MNLTGIQIFKHLPGGLKLPKANCKKCGFATCMAFALKLAQKQIDFSACPYVSDELKNLFEEFSKKQQNEIKFGENMQLTIGGETVMQRHEKTFVNKTVIAIQLSTDDKDFDKKLDEIANYQVERVGETFKVDAINLIDKGNILEKAKNVTNKGLALIISTFNPYLPYELKKYNPIFYFKDTTKIEASYKDSRLVVNGSTLEKMAKKAEQLISQKITENIILDYDLTNKNLASVIEDMTKIRRLGIQSRDEKFAHPVMTKISGRKSDYEKLSIASFLLCRYSSIIVFDTFDKAMLTTLMTLRQNIYTDPQKPLQVEPKVYEMNEPDENSIIFLTTNFALTYFAVANELESSAIPSYLIVTPSDGMSVLTAWSADKFTAEIVTKAVRNSNLYEKVKIKKIIIPGLLSHMQEELQEALPEWEIVVGTNEAYKIPEFVNKMEQN